MAETWVHQLLNHSLLPVLLLPLGVLVPATAEAPAAPAHGSDAFSNAKTDSDDTSVASTRPHVQQ
jgi:hypothetical protein